MIYIIGAGNHGRVVSDNFNSGIKFLDDNTSLHNKIINEKFEVVNSIDQIYNYKNEISSIILGLGEKYIKIRYNLFIELEKEFIFSKKEKVVLILVLLN